MVAKSDAGSVKSGGSSMVSSSAGSNKSAQELLKKRKKKLNEEDDMLDEKKTLEDAAFSAMYSLSRDKFDVVNSWQYSFLKLVLEGLVPLLVFFTPGPTWDINENIWVWTVTRWVVFANPVAQLYSYDAYIIIMYVLVVTTFIVVAGIVFLTWAMRQAEQSKALKSFAKCLQLLADIIFVMLYMVMLDYMLSLWHCSWGDKGDARLLSYPDVYCLKSPHMINMVIAGITTLVIIMFSAGMVVAGCDLNPAACGLLATPAASMRLRIIFAKSAYVISYQCLEFTPKLQSLLMFVSVLIVFWLNLRTLPFYRDLVNCIWVGSWFLVAYTVGLYFVNVWDLGFSRLTPTQMTQAFLFGAIPAFLVGAALTWLHLKWTRRALVKFDNVLPTAKLRKVYKFNSTNEVAVLSRVMRKFDVDGVVDPELSAKGEIILKCGMARFPKDPYLLIIYANYLMEVKHDGPASRTQLQTAAKSQPDMVERYQIFCTVEKSKRLRDGDGSQLDLQSYVEYKRNYRALVRTHHEALTSQRDFWKLLLRTNAHMHSIDRAFREMDDTMERAKKLYSRLLERYSNNAKIMKCYGRFQEDVCNDPRKAAKYYHAAAKTGSSEAIMQLDIDFHGQNKPEFLTSMDMNEDAVCIIDAVGTILMVNEGVSELFGYTKSELEGANVSMLMPLPFSQRHPSYLQRYVDTGLPHILDSVREVVGLHKEKFVFPLELCVTKLSGVGADCVFLGLLRPMAVSIHNVRAWVAPSGTILCTDQQFCSIVGLAGDALVGRQFTDLATDETKMAMLLERSRSAPPQEFERGNIYDDFELKHKFLGTVPVRITVRMGGTDSQRLFVMNIEKHEKNDESLLVVDRHGRVCFGSYDLAVLLGYSLKHLYKMKFEQFLPAPFNHMHNRWIKSPPHQIPATSCRAGTIVHLLNASRTPVPVKLTISAAETTDEMRHIIRIKRMGADDFEDDRRICLTCDMQGTITAVTPPGSKLYNFPADTLAGRSVCEAVDIFDEWKERSGSGDMQLLMLALMDKENEMPGTSWRVKVRQPQDLADAQAAATEAAQASNTLRGLLAARGAEPPSAPKSAVLLVETVELENGAAVRLHLWRRDILTGSLELDEKLRVRKADKIAGLIVGHPHATMLNVPLSKILGFDANATWDGLMGHKAKRGALKVSHAGHLSAPKPFEAQHPDGGGMRILVQGLSMTEMNGRTRVQATLRADTTFKGARANVWVALGLQKALQNDSGAKTGGEQGSSQTSTSKEEADGAGADRVSDAGGSGEGLVTGEGSRALVRSNTQSELIRQWIRTISANKAAMDLTPPNMADGSAQLEAVREDLLGEAELEGMEGGDDGDGSSTSASSPRASTPRGEQAVGDDKTGGDTKAFKEDEDEDEPLPEAGTGLGARVLRASSSNLGSKRTRSPILGVGPPPSRRVHSPIPEGRPSGASKSQKKQKARVLSKELSKDLDPRDRMLTEDEALAMAMDLPEDALTGPPVNYTEAKKPAERQALSRHHDRDALAGLGGGEDPAGGMGLTAAAVNAAGDDGASEMSGDDDGQSFARSMSSMGSRHDEMLVDSRRGRVLKRLNRLLLGERLEAPINRLRYHAWAMLFVMLVVHAVCFIIFLSLVQAQSAHVSDTQHMFVAMDRTQVVAVRTRIIEYCQRPEIAPNVNKSVCEQVVNSPDAFYKNYKANIDELEANHQNVYFGLNKLQRIADSTTYDIMTDKKSVNYTLWMDTSPPSSTSMQDGLFVVTNRYIAAAREVLASGPKLKQAVNNTRAFQFIAQNSESALFEPYMRALDHYADFSRAHLNDMRAGLISLLVVEAAVVQAGIIAYLTWLIWKTEAVRLTNYIVMVGLPAPILRALSGKPIKILDNDSDEDLGGDDEDDDQAKAAANAEANKSVGKMDALTPRGSTGGSSAAGSDFVPRQHSIARPVSGADPSELLFEDNADAQMSRSAPVKLTNSLTPVINGKTLHRSYARMAVLVSPMALWVALLVALYVASYIKLNHMEAPLAALTMAAHVIARFTHVRDIAFKTVTMVGLPQEAALIQAKLATELMNLESEYDTLMYGGLAITQIDSPYQFEIPASTFSSETFSDNFFRSKKCFRYDQSLCYGEDNKYYEVTHNGLDVMMRRCLTELKLMAQDHYTDILYNASRYDLMYYVGIKDLYEGLQASAQLYVDYSLDKYSQIMLLHITLLIITILLVFAYAVFMLEPYLRYMQAQTQRVADLMSHVPDQISVTSYARAVLRARDEVKPPPPS